jgi:urease accessory protein
MKFSFPLGWSVGLWMLGISMGWGHPGHEVVVGSGGFAVGFLHPLSGLDHLLAMVAVGLWAGQLGGRAVWIVPLSFVGAMLLGGVLGFSVGAPFWVESGIALSVFFLGLAVALAWKLPVFVPAGLVALFALAHGMAHGAEMPAGSSPEAYAAGFALATAGLHAAGLGLGLLLSRIPRRPVLRSLGGAVALCGAVLFVLTLA